MPTPIVSHKDEFQEIINKCIVSMRDIHTSQIKLCEHLEEVADSLPKNINKQYCLHLARSIFPMIKSAHEIEEQEFFPILEKVKPEDVSLAASIERLRYEHCEDECSAEDVTTVLFECGQYGAVKNPERAGYILRTFFAGVRRHIAFEREYLLPMAERALKNTAS
ncbi:MAG: hemerythrin domain-containing protein [Hyphomicrobiaceae bacterium]